MATEPGKSARNLMPVTLMFQPTHYEVVPPEQLAQWESTMRTIVGLDPHAAMRLRNTETWSISYGEWGWDDCDAI
jgi:hypothetical protein